MISKRKRGAAHGACDEQNTKNRVEKRAVHVMSRMGGNDEYDEQIGRQRFMNTVGIGTHNEQTGDRFM